MSAESAPSLAVGARLGHYVIRRAIGAGGMGEVFEAEDTRLRRRVALKVVRREVAADPLRRARLEREATAAATLSHPNIVTVHSLEEEAGTLFITMELIDGLTLAETLPPGGVPIDRLLPLAIQLAEALSIAHASGVVHRDLKPANVMLTRSGRIKVLDFGLSRLSVDDAGEAVTTIQLTTDGALFGTASYISPEHIQGREPDARSDIFAFGVMLYELATGRRPFDGPTVMATLAAIAKDTPPLASDINPDIPEELARIINRCLVKDPGRRIQSAIDLHGQLEDLAEMLRAPARRIGKTPDASGRRSRKRRTRTALLATAAAVIAVLTAGVWWWSRRPESVNASTGTTLPTTHTTIELPETGSLALGAYVPVVGFEGPMIAISPDGRRLAYIALAGAETVIYLRELARTEFTRVSGTDGAIHPFFSPDGQWIGFLTDDKVKKVPVDGGAVTTLCNVQQPLQGWWINDAIYFSHTAGRQLSRVAADGGGGPVTVIEPAALRSAIGGVDWRFSDVLPDGKSFLVTRCPDGMSAEFAEIVVVTGEPIEKRKALLQSGYGARYVPHGYVVFARGGNLLSVQFDSRRLELSGQPVRLVSGVSMDSLWGQVHVAISHTGVLAYIPGGDRAMGKLAWVDRAGRTELLDAPARLYGVLDLSRDGKRLAVVVADVNDYFWLYDLERREGRRLGGKGSYDSPRWNPDGRSLAFSRFDGTTSRLFVQPVDAGEPREIPAPPGSTPDSWLPDGITLAYHRGRRLGFTSVDGNDRMLGIDGMWSSVSPDGKWFAYNSPAQDEIWVASYPDAKVRRRISDSGKEPRWCTCGDLFYRWGKQWFTTTVSTASDIQWSPPRIAFESSFVDTPGVSYAVSPKGDRLLLVQPTQVDVRTQIGVVTTWWRAAGGS